MTTIYKVLYGGQVHPPGLQATLWLCDLKFGGGGHIGMARGVVTDDETTVLDEPTQTGYDADWRQFIPLVVAHRLRDGWVPGVSKPWDYRDERNVAAELDRVAGEPHHDWEEGDVVMEWET